MIRRVWALVLSTALILSLGYGCASAMGPMLWAGAETVSQTCVIVTVRDGFGTGLADVTVTRDGGNAKQTDSSGRTFWCLTAESTGTTLAIPGGTILAASGRDCRASVSGAVTWTAGANEYVYVDLTASVVASAPTATQTATPPLHTPTITPTPGPTSTPLETLIPDYSVPFVIIEAKPEVQTDRFTYTWWPNKAEVKVFSANGDSFPQSGPTPHSVEATGWIRFHVVPEPGLYPPTVIVVTATPGETPEQTPTPNANPSATPTLTKIFSKTPKPENLTPTISVSATSAPTQTPWVVTATPEPTPPDAAPDPGPTLTLNDDISRVLDRCEDETGERPFILWLVDINMDIDDIIEGMRTSAEGHPYLFYWSQ